MKSPTSDPARAGYPPVARGWRARLLRRIDHPGFPVFLGGLAGIDQFAVVLPIDALLIASVAGAGRRWKSIAFGTALGSTLGAALLVAMVQLQGTAAVQKLAPGLFTSPSWSMAGRWMDHFGLGAVFAFAAIPIIQQPILVVAALLGTSLWLLVPTYLAGRLLKYLLMAFLTMRAGRVAAGRGGLAGR